MQHRRGAHDLSQTDRASSKVTRLADGDAREMVGPASFQAGDLVSQLSKQGPAGALYLPQQEVLVSDLLDLDPSVTYEYRHLAPTGIPLSTSSRLQSPCCRDRGPVSRNRAAGLIAKPCFLTFTESGSAEQHLLCCVAHVCSCLLPLTALRCVCRLRGRHSAGWGSCFSPCALCQRYCCSPPAKLCSFSCMISSLGTVVWRPAGACLQIQAALKRVEDGRSHQSVTV